MKVLPSLGLLALLRTGAAGAQEEDERVTLAGREELAGRITGCDAGGTIRFRTKAGRDLSIPVERIVRIQFRKPEAVRHDPAAPRVQFFHGSILSGTVAGFRDRKLTVAALGREFHVRREDVRMVQFGPIEGAMPETKDEKKDLVIAENDKKANVAHWGDLVSITGTALVLDTGTEKSELPRKAVRRLVLYHGETRRDPAMGWFARIILGNGDRVVGVLSAVTEASVEVFSHVLGNVALEKRQIHSLAFLQYARTTAGHTLVCDQTGVREFDRSGRELWSYTTNVQYAWAAVRLENGNTLIANTNYNQVIEVNPQREIVWQADSMNYPYDVQRLENGNTLVAEYYGNRVSELDPQKNRVWACTKVQNPIGVQRLENGNTLITGNNQVVEVDRQGNEVWRAQVDRLRPWRALRLDNGNTLISDYQRGMVIEIDAANREVWKKEGLVRPMAAVRLEDGNTLILEQGANRVVELDFSKRQVNEIKGLLSPQGMTSY
ncbi:MAG: PQQ-binding-like beta-propeller repeat protein [Planctomycetes bacterium]|nr:PQQ-binding-like beta-propeller repeat protein [Planctomycetota bacterium]